MVPKMKTIEEAINQIIRWSFIKVQMEQTLMLITQDLTKHQQVEVSKINSHRMM